MKKRILLIRTHKNISAGGPVPPLGLLHIASEVIKNFEGNFELKIINTGLNNSLKEAREVFSYFQPDIVGLSTLTCEAGLMHDLSSYAKKNNSKTLVVAGGPHATLIKGNILEDKNIDFAVIGEGELTFIELLKEIEGERNFEKVKGIAWRRGRGIVLNEVRPFIEELDDFTILPDAWNLISLKEYGKYTNWNGVCRDRYYMPILTSRGCPFNCVFCRSRDTFGRKFRVRSPASIIKEILFLSRKYQIREIHFYDDSFNFDLERANEICSLLISTREKFSLAFPNGLRIDRMPDVFLRNLRRAGTYKINFGIESGSPRIQSQIKKDIDLRRALEVINKVFNTGILSSGYFILGFPGETKEEMLLTIDFAVNSRLDNAYFFKFIDYSSAISFQDNSTPRFEGRSLSDFNFYSSNSSSSSLPLVELNNLMLIAQQRFYLGKKRILWGLLRSARKSEFLKSLIYAVSLIIQSYLIIQLSKKDKELINNVN